VSGGRPRRPANVPGNVHERRTPTGWVARTSVRDAAGVYRQVTRTRSSRAAARTAVLAAAQALAPQHTPAGTDELTGATTLAQLLPVWLAEHTATKGLRSQSVVTYRHAIEGVPAEIGALTLEEATTPRLDRAIKARAAQAPGAARTMRSVLRMALDLAVRHGAVGRNAADGTAPVPKGSKPVVALDAEQEAQLRAHLETVPADDVLDRQVALLAVVLLATGLRIGEALALRAVDLDLDAATPTLTVAGTVVPGTERGLVWQAEPKTAAGFRRVPLPPAAVDALREALEQPFPRDQLDLVFPGARGGLRQPGNVRTRLKALFLAAGLDPRGSHVFRRTAATKVSRAHGLEAAAALLGQVGTATVRRHYVAQAHDAPDVRDALEPGSPGVS